MEGQECYGIAATVEKCDETGILRWKQS